MTKESAKSLWTLVHQYEDLLNGNHLREVPPCPEGLGRELSLAEDSLFKLEDEINVCNSCHLRETATAPLLGEGKSNAKILFVGGSPSELDDKNGRVFFPGENDFFHKWLEAIGLNREEDCYLSLINRCLTPGGRIPLADEQYACIQYLNREISIIKPKLIVALGPYPFSALTQQPAQFFNESINGLCMNEESHLPHAMIKYHDIPLFPLYHPSFVLQNQHFKKDVWNILKKIKKVLS